MGWGYYDYRPYVPVAKRRAQAVIYAAKLAKKEKRVLEPIALDGRAIATSFWGQAWCDNLEGYSDYANRLPRGRTYVRNGSVVDLQIQRGQVKAIVGGSDVYEVAIRIKTVAPKKWDAIKKDCTRSIDSLVDLLQGRFDQGIMARLCERKAGLFPHPDEIEKACSCPDWAGMCKHVAAVLYGVGARLDKSPELLFTLRDVDHLELVKHAADADNLDRSLNAGTKDSLAGADLGEIFGIELEVSPSKKTARKRDLPAGARVKASPKTKVGKKRALKTAAGKRG